MEVPATVGAQVTAGNDSDVQQVTSPDGSITVTVDISSGVPEYDVAVDGTTYIDPSPLGFDFADQSVFGSGVSGTGAEITVTGSESVSDTESWTPEWGDYDSVSEPYDYLTLGLEEAGGPGRSANLRVRVFDDGLGFQVAFGEAFGEFTITAENTEFNFSSDYTAWWIPNAFLEPRFEDEYTESSLSDILAGDWDETVVDAAIGDYIVTARRQGEAWYLGAMTDGTARDVTVSLDFLSVQSDGWAVTEYTDADGTDVDTNPTEVAIDEYAVSTGDSVTISMAAGGGTAMQIVPAEGIVSEER